MITDCATIDSALKKHFGNSCEILSKHHASGGCINQAHRLELSTGQTVFVKENSDRFVDMFATEAQGLTALNVNGGPRVPEPIALYSGRGTQFIVMTGILQGARGNRFWENFGHTLATLHKHPTSDHFGFSKDNYIGSTPQINTHCKSWVEFFEDTPSRIPGKIGRKTGARRLLSRSQNRATYC
jgi:protein-ribulosamine 3-kinase